MLCFAGGTKNDVADGPRVQIHQLWPRVPDPWGLFHQTGKKLPAFGITHQLIKLYTSGLKCKIKKKK